MSNLREVNNLIERMRRIMCRAMFSHGEGEVWEAEVPGYGFQTFRLTGLKSPTEIEDDLANLGIWVWSVKDYIKRFVQSQGGNPKTVEDYVNSNPDLPICADIANSAKHGMLLKSRSDRFLRAGKLEFKIPQTATAFIKFLPDEIHIDVSRPELVTFRYPLVDRDGNEVGDALLYLQNGVAAWETFLGQNTKDL